MKKLVIIPDSFKGTISSREAGRILREEAAARWPQAEIICVEVADGGEGSVDAFLSVLPGEKKYVSVQGPYGKEMSGFYGKIGNMAVIEMAAVAGLPLVGNDLRVGQTTTYGVGQLICAALDDGAEEIVLGLGGSATNDGGAGAAAALGVRFLDCDGQSFVPVGDTLSQICKIDISQRDPRLEKVKVTVMCDIDNPLCGPSGAAAMFAPQKGAEPDQIRLLDAGLHNMAEIIQRDLGRQVLDLPGAGAAGGMGAGCVAFFDAILHSGIDVVLNTVHFDEMLDNCSMVLTGEGRIDGQSIHGKVITGIARRAQKFGIPVVAIVGSIADGAEAMYDVGVSAIFSINPRPEPFSIARQHAFENLRHSAQNIFRFAQAMECIK